MATSSASHSASGSHNGPQWPYYGPLAQYVKEQQVLEGEFKSIRDDKHVKVKQRYPKLLTFGEKSLGAHQRLLESNVKVILEHAALYRMAQGVIKAAFPLVSLSTDNQGREAKRAIDALRGVMLNQPQPPEKAAVTTPSESAEGPFIPVPYIIPETSRVAEKLKSQKPALLEIAASAFGPKVETPIHDLKQKLGEQQKAFAALDERSTSLTTVVSKSLEELAIQQNRLAKEWSQLLIGREFNAWELTRIEIFANILSELRDFSEKLEEFNKKRLTYQRDLENQKNPAPRLDEFKERFEPIQTEHRQLNENAEGYVKTAEGRIIELKEFLSKKESGIEERIQAIPILDPKTREEIDAELREAQKTMHEEATTLLQELEKGWRYVSELRTTLTRKMERLDYALNKNGGKVPFESTRDWPIIGWTTRQPPEEKVDAAKDAKPAEKVKEEKQD